MESKNDENSKENTEKKNKNLSQNNLITVKENIALTNKKDELLYFKNDILKELKNSITDLNNIYNKKIFEIEKQLEEVYIKSETSYKKISNITEGITNHKAYQQRFSQIEKFQSKLRDSTMNTEFKLKNLENLLQETITKYDKIILDSILYPGVIGKKNEFQTFHDLIDFLLINLKKLLNAKEKENLETKKTKDRIDANLELFKEQIDGCLNRVENFNQEIINYNLDDMFKDIKDLKNKAKEEKKFDNSIIKKIEENEKKLDKININLTNSLKENAENFNILLTNGILDINNNIKTFQDKYNENIKEFESIKQDVMKNKIILFDIMNHFSNHSKRDKKNINNYYNHENKIDDRMNSTLDLGKSHYKGESKVKQYIEGILKLSDLNKSHSFSKKENSIKNILSDIEMDLIKNKKKYINLNIRNKSDFNFDKDMNDNINKENLTPSSNRNKKIIKKDKIESNVIRYTKIPKIKQYNNLNILNEREEKFIQKIKNSKYFISPMNEYGFVNINEDINNSIHSKSLSNEDIHDEKENMKSSSKIYLKKAKEEEKKNENEEARLFYKLEENKISKGTNDKHIIISPVKNNEINSLKIREKLLSAKDRNRSSSKLIEQKELFQQKANNKSNSNTKLVKIDKSNRMNSSKVLRENVFARQMDINFEDKQILHTKDSHKFKKSINQIKNNQPLKDKDYIQERVKNFLQFSYRKPSKKNKNVY